MRSSVEERAVVALRGSLIVKGDEQSAWSGVSQGIGCAYVVTSLQSRLGR